MKTTTVGQADSRNNGAAQVQFAVGFKFEGKTEHVVVDAEDALIAALKLR